MTQHIKKTLLLFVALLTAFSASAFAVKNAEGVYIYYKITSTSEQTVEVVWNSNNKYSGAVNIPSNIIYNENVYTVTSIAGNAFSGCADLTSVTIPESITSLGEVDYHSAFYGCKGLTTVNYNAINADNTDALFYPEGVRSPFAECPNLTTVKFGDKVETIPDCIFYRCKGLTTISFGKSVETIGEESFEGCSSLTSVSIPETVTRIGGGAFAECTELTTVNYNAINANTSSKYSWRPIFEGCQNLTKVNISNNVETISDGIFYSCEGLSHIKIPESVTTIGLAAFKDCNQLYSVELSEGLNTIGVGAFWGCPICEITIPESVTTIGERAFYGCHLYEITIPESITTIGEGVFALNEYLRKFYGKYASDNNRSLIIDGVLIAVAPYGLTSFTIQNGVTRIGSYAFLYCAGLPSIVIPNSVTTIGEYAFCGCSGLTSVSIGKSVTSIDEWAFGDCDQLATVINYSDLPIVAGSDEYGGVAYFAKEVIKGVLADYVTLNKNNIEMKIGEFEFLDATVFPDDTTDKTVVWASSDESVASINNNGKVMAIKVGKATITATCGSVYATCEVTVVDESSIETLSADEDGREVEVFTLQGVKVADKDLAPGVYIRRVGDKAEKVLVK